MFLLFEKMEKIILDYCGQIQEIVGLYQREHVYRDLLLQRLRTTYSDALPEVVVPFRSDAGNGHCLRIDIDVPSQKAMLELKSTNAMTKEEVFWQVRSYLENMDRTTGYIVNFMSKQRVVELFVVRKTDKHTASGMRKYTRSVALYTQKLGKVFEEELEL